MTRILATGLSLAMAFSLTAATNVTTAAAAPSLMRVSTKTLTEGQTRKVLMNNKDESVASKYRIKNTTRDAAAKKIINVAKVGPKKQGIDITAKKTAVTDAGLEQAKGVVTINFVKKADANKKNAKVVKKFKLTVVVKAKAKPVVDETTKITVVTQKEATKLEVTLSKEAKDAKAADFGIVRDASNAIVAISAATVDAKDATKVTLTTYESLTDGKTYTVTYTAADEAKTQSSVQFTATDGIIDSLNLTPLTITAGKATTIKYQTLDKSGVLLSEKSIGSPATGIEVNTTYNDGYYTSAGNLFLTNVDDTAKIVVSYHTYKYDTDGSEIGVIEKEFSVKAVDSASVADYDYTIATAKPYNWNTAKKSTQIAMEDTTYNAYIRIKDVNGDVLSDSQAQEYSVESSNNNVLLAAGTADNAIALTPVAQGTAYLMVSKDGKTVASLPVNVVAKRVLTTVKVSNASANIATNTAVLALSTGNVGNAVIGVETFDQYGVAIGYSNASDAEITVTSKPVTATGNELVTTYNPTAKAIVVDSNASDVTAGTYGFKVTFKDVYGNAKSGVFSVKVVSGWKVSSIKLAASEVDNTGLGNGTTTSVDTTLSAGNTAAKSIMIHAVGVGSNGVVVSGAPLSQTVSLSAIKVTGSDGTVYAASGSGTVVTSQAIDDNALQTAMSHATTTGALKIKVRANLGGNRIRKYLPAGVYTVQYTVKDGTKSGTKPVIKTYTTQFTVKDEQPKTTVKIAEPNIGSSSIEAAFKSADCAVFSYDGIALTTSGSSDVTSVFAVIGAANGSKATVQSVVVGIPVTVGTTTYYIDTVVPVNVTFTGTSGSFSNVSKKSALQLYNGPLA